MENASYEADLKTVKAMASLAYAALDSKQAEEIRILDIHEISVLADYFIIANGRNPNHVRALMDEVEDKLAENGYEPVGREGLNSYSWGLLDYNHVIIHIFSKDMRKFYNLERIWQDGKVVDPKDLQV